jgi:glycerophosphoryl diester phosphodiesterase
LGEHRSPFGICMASKIKPFANIGNRGAPIAVPPGNTIASLTKALEVGVHMLKVDVRHTRDDIIILYHDAVRMVEDREVPIRSRSFAEWKPHFEQSYIPLATLDEAFALASQANVGLMLDFRTPGMETLLARAIRSSGFPLDSLIVTGADEGSRVIMRGLDPRIPLGMSLEVSNTKAINAKFLSEIDTDAVTWHHRWISPPIVQILHKREILVFAGPTDVPEDMRKMRAAEVDGIFTNYPEILRKI